MNFKFLILVFFAISLSNFALATPLIIEFERDSYFSGETVQGKIFSDGSLEEDIRSTDFYLSFNSSDYDVYPVLNEFENYTYFYFDIPIYLAGGSYNLVIKDVLHVVNGILVEEDQIFSLNINEYDGAVLSIDPAIIRINLETDNWFTISMNNPSLESTTVNINFSDDFIFTNYDSFLLNSESSKNVQFYVSSSFADKSESFIYVNYDNLSYSIPIFIEGLTILGEDNISDPLNDTNASETIRSIVFLQREFDLDLKEGESIPGFVQIFNDFNKELTNVKIILSESLEGIVDLEFSEIEFIDVGESVKDHIYINENKNVAPGEYEGSLDLEYNGEIYDTISIFVSILSESIVEENVTGEGESEGEGEGESEGEDGNLKLFIGLLVFVLILGLLIYLKYKKSKKETNSPFEKN
jgi:hypothetical protein